MVLKYIIGIIEKFFLPKYNNNITAKVSGQESIFDYINKNLEENSFLDISIKKAIYQQAKYDCLRLKIAYLNDPEDRDFYNPFYLAYSVEHKLLNQEEEKILENSLEKNKNNLEKFIRKYYIEKLPIKIKEEFLKKD